MNWYVTGTRAGVWYGLGSGESILGEGDCHIDEDAVVSPQFEEVLKTTGYKCSWAIFPTESQEEVRITLRSGEKVGLELGIVWPAARYQAAERMMRHLFLSPQAQFRIAIPLPSFRAGDKNLAAPLSYAEFMAGKTYRIPLSSESPRASLFVGFEDDAQA
jgi:hypothetical protein